jgi:hypothetical protein
MKKRAGPRRVTGDASRSKKSAVTEELPRGGHSTATTTTTHLHEPVHSDERQETWLSKGTKGLETPSKTEGTMQSQRHQEPAPWTPESAHTRPLPKDDGSDSLPSPQSLRSDHRSPEVLEPPSSRPSVPVGQHNDDMQSPGVDGPPSAHIRSGVSLFHHFGPPNIHSGVSVGQGSLPQSPHPNVRLESQVEALRDHISSQQRPPDANFVGGGGPAASPGVWRAYPSNFAANPQAQGANPLYENRPGLRSVRPPQVGIVPSALPASGFPDPKRTTLEGYELLASKLTDGSVGARPMYRGFEHLHHRLLLYLQDEICEYEEELRKLDEWIAQCGSTTASDSRSKATSRRAEARLTHADGGLLFRRKLILGEIFLKFERYREYMLNGMVGAG